MITYYNTGNEQGSTATAATAVAPTAGRYLIFYLGREEYGIEASRIREIISLMPLQLAAGLPFCVRGVLHILGKIIPVIDLRLKLGLAKPVSEQRRPGKDPDATWMMGEGPDNGQTCGLHSDEEHIVVLETKDKQPVRHFQGWGETELPRTVDHMSWEFGFIGIVVDYVSEIAVFRSEDIEPVSSGEKRQSQDCVLGQVRAGGGTRTILDIDLALNLDYLPDYAVSRSL